MKGKKKTTGNVEVLNSFSNKKNNTFQTASFTN